MLDESGNRFAFVTDQVGSVRQVVEVSTGAVVQSMRYTAFGEVLEDEDFSADFPPQPFGYAGGLYDRETGFVRFGARDCDAATRRWTAKDPIRFRGRDTNLLACVGNNPVEAVDPTGLQAVPSPDTWAGMVFRAQIAFEPGLATATNLAVPAAAAAVAQGIGACWDRISEKGQEVSDTGVVATMQERLAEPALAISPQDLCLALKLLLDSETDTAVKLRIRAKMKYFHCANVAERKSHYS